MKVTVKPQIERVFKLVVDMKPGEVGYIRDSNCYDGALVVRVYDGLHSLSAPNWFWSWGSLTGGNAPDFKIEMLPKGTEVILTVE